MFLYIVYDGGRFTVSLDRNLSNRKNIYLSEDGDVKNKRLKLSAQTIDYMDNIDWVMSMIDDYACLCIDVMHEERKEHHD